MNYLYSFCYGAGSAQHPKYLLSSDGGRVLD